MFLLPASALCVLLFFLYHQQCVWLLNEHASLRYFYFKNEYESS